MVHIEVVGLGQKHAKGLAVLMSGVRPNEMDWYRVERPDWYVGEGWALTPESGPLWESWARAAAGAASRMNATAGMRRRMIVALSM